MAVAELEAELEAEVKIVLKAEVAVALVGVGAVALVVAVEARRDRREANRRSIYVRGSIAQTSVVPAARCRNSTSTKMVGRVGGVVVMTMATRPRTVPVLVQAEVLWRVVKGSR